MSEHKKFTLRVKEWDGCEKFVPLVSHLHSNSTIGTIGFIDGEYFLRLNSGYILEFNSPYFSGIGFSYSGGRWRLSIKQESEKIGRTSVCGMFGPTANLLTKGKKRDSQFFPQHETYVGIIERNCLTYGKDIFLRLARCPLLVSDVIRMEIGLLSEWDKKGYYFDGAMGARELLPLFKVRDRISENNNFSVNEEGLDLLMELYGNTDVALEGFYTAQAAFLCTRFKDLHNQSDGMIIMKSKILNQIADLNSIRVFDANHVKYLDQVHDMLYEFVHLCRGAHHYNRYTKFCHSFDMKPSYSRPDIKSADRIVFE